MHAVAATASTSPFSLRSFLRSLLTQFTLLLASYPPFHPFSNLSCFYSLYMSTRLDRHTLAH